MERQLKNKGKELQKQRDELKSQNIDMSRLLTELEESNERINKLYEGLKVKEKRYREFAERLPGIVFETDMSGKVVFVNQKSYEILGVNPELLGDEINVFDFVHPEDYDKVKKNLELIAINQEITDNEYRIIDNKGEVLHVYAFAIPVFSEKEITGLRGLLLDITKMKKYEERVRLFEDIVSHMGLGLNVYKYEEFPSRSNFVLEMINPASEKMVRFSNAGNIGKNLDELSPLLHHLQLNSIFKRTLQSKIPDEIEDFVYQPESTDSPSIFNLKIFPLPKNRVAVLLHDITARRNTEAMLRMNQFGIENAGDIILWINENGQFVYCNQTACSRYHYSRKELMGMRIIDIDPRMNMMKWYELVQIMESKSSLTMESLNKSGKGQVFPVEMAMNKFIYEGKKNYFTLIRDISERKRNDELEQKFQVARNAADLKQQFLATMSHEIRTPMTGIMGMTSLLLKTKLDSTQCEYVRNIKISSENLLHIINDVLDLSKIEAGKMELNPGSIELKIFVDQLNAMFLHMAKQKDLEFTTWIDPNIPASIIADEHRLKQIFNNLLSNAFKFTDQGGIAISLNLLEKKDNMLTIVAQVQDTGMGISEENQRKIFEKFTQLSNSLVRPFEGTGLGLAICRELTQLMGGGISVESAPDKGSVFIFTFQAAIDPLASSHHPPLTANNYNDLGLRVLHVEDKQLNQKVVGLILSNASCQVDFVKNGKEAIELYFPGKYDIILMDIEMPVLDGISACKELKKLYGERLCPVIGLSANALEGDAGKFIDQGLDDYIAKPFKPDYLYKKLYYWKNKSHSITENQ